MDGNKECMFWHPKGQQGTASTNVDENGLPVYKANECLPEEYLEKVRNYFDDTQVTNVNMIQTLMK